MNEKPTSERECRFEIIARRMLIDIACSSCEYLPPIFTLAKQYNVAKGTISKALHLLVAEGAVKVSRGKQKTIRVVKRENSRVPDQTGYSEKVRALADKIESEIISGIRKTGQPMPKLDFFARDEHICRQSVQEAYRLLAGKKLAHKKGRWWVAGPDRSPFRFRSDPDERPVIVLICKDYNEWNIHWQTKILIFHSFCLAFRDEVEKSGYAFGLAYMDISSSDAYIPRGKDECLSYIRSLKKRYAGALLFTVKSKEADEWVLSLAQFEKPLVLFEAGGIEQPLHKKTVSTAGKNLLRCSFNQQGLADIAVGSLARLGHKRVGTVRIGPGPDSGYVSWTPRRAAQIVAAAKKSSPRISVEVECQDEPFMRDESWTQKENLFLDYLYSCVKNRRETAPEEQEKRTLPDAEIMKTCFPSLVRLIDERHVTAIIAPDDFAARMYMVWMKESRIAVPGDVSLIGFDNDARSHHYNISSVDPGLDTLGYLASHFIIGDIPVAVGKNRVLDSRCKLVDRGSLGPPPGMPLSPA